MNPEFLTGQTLHGGSVGSFEPGRYCPGDTWKHMVGPRTLDQVRYTWWSPRTREGSLGS